MFYQEAKLIISKDKLGDQLKDTIIGNMKRGEINNLQWQDETEKTVILCEFRYDGFTYYCDVKISRYDKNKPFFKEQIYSMLQEIIGFTDCEFLGIVEYSEYML